MKSIMNGLFKKLKGKEGFTLVEIGIVLLISGMTMLVAANFVKLYTINSQYEKTLENMRFAQDAIEEFAGLNGVYPCPADPSLAPGDPNYGVSLCRNYADVAFDPDACLNVPGNISCTTAFSRDGDNNGSTDTVMIGVVPFRTLADNVVDTPFREAYRFDGYSTTLTYAITEHMTNTVRHSLINPANPNTGSIRVEDENAISLTTPDDSAHLVLFSHGDNRRGGYTRDGNMVDDCMVSSGGLPPALPAPGPSGSGMDLEIENCENNDAIFVKSFRSLGVNDGYNDDILFFTATGLTPLWKRSLASPAGESHIYNTNLGNVGIGTDLPTHRLHVVGDLSGEASVISLEYCNEAESDCLDPDAIAGSGSICGANEVAYAVGDNEVKCRTVTWTNPNKSCAAIGGNPSFMQGFSNLGDIYCCTVANVCQEQ